MKKMIVVLLLFVAWGSQAQIKNATLQASGLTCAMCSKAVFKALSNVPFVAQVKPDIEGSSYEIAFKPGAAIELDALGKAVVDAGFSVSKLKVLASFSNTRIENDAHVVIDGQSFHFLNVTPQTLDGAKQVTVLDKNFVTAKEHKKNSKLTAMKCYETGTMNGKRTYHVTL